MIINEEEKLKQFIKDNKIIVEHLKYEKSLHTVQDLLRVTGLDLEFITKTMIFKGKQGKTIAAMVPAKFRVSTKRIGKILGTEPPELANQNKAYKRTGVLEKEYVYTGGGSEFSIVKISSEELKKLKPIIQKITGKKSN